MAIDPSANVSRLAFIVEQSETGRRLDALLAQRFPDFSRVQLRRAISQSRVLVDGQSTKAALRVRGGQHVILSPPEPRRLGPEPENIPLSILYEDEQLMAVNKPANMVVHPSKGHGSGTLAAALAYHFDQLSARGGSHRPGIVHRLDRETSGVLVVAKTDQAHLSLASQFEARVADKHYLAVVVGTPDRDRDRIDQSIGIHPYQREKMAIRAAHPSSRSASTFYEVLERFAGFAYVRVRPKTGRTHQIRVHLSHIGCPVLCDRLYGGRSRIARGELAETADPTWLLQRQALHAHRLQLTHPVTDELMTFEAPLPDDMQAVLSELRTHRPRGRAE